MGITLPSLNPIASYDSNLISDAEIYAENIGNLPPLLVVNEKGLLKESNIVDKDNLYSTLERKAQKMNFEENLYKNNRSK